MDFLCACVGLIIDLHEIYEEKQGKIRHEWEVWGCCCQKVDENIFRAFKLFCNFLVVKIFKKHSNLNFSSATMASNNPALPLHPK